MTKLGTVSPYKDYEKAVQCRLAQHTRPPALINRRLIFLLTPVLKKHSF